MLQTDLCYIIIYTLQVFLPLPLHFFSTTSTLLQADAQSNSIIPTLPFQMLKPSQSAMPHYLTATLWTPKRLYKSSLRHLSFKDTPHTHLTMIPSALSRLCRFSGVFQAWNWIFEFGMELILKDVFVTDMCQWDLNALMLVEISWWNAKVMRIAILIYKSSLPDVLDKKMICSVNDMSELKIKSKLWATDDISAMKKVCEIEKMLSWF